MDPRLEKLRQLGCDVDTALKRFLDDEKLYLKCFEELLTDDSLQQLDKAIKSDSSSDAFHFSHKLKSVYANMGLTPLYDDCVVIVEAARKGKLARELEINCSRMKAFTEKLKQI